MSESNPVILYTGDNEGPCVMRLENLIASFDETGGWQFRHNESDMRHEMDSRGWYEGIHDNGHYLAVNLDKLNLMPHPSMYEKFGAVHPDLGGLKPEPAPAAPAKRSSRFFDWFDPMTAKALTTAAGLFMAPRGFTIMHTGGGCLAWEKQKPDSKWGVWITNEDAGLGDDIPADKFETVREFSAMMQHEDGLFVNGPAEMTIAECLAWGESMLAKSDDELNAESEQ